MRIDNEYSPSYKISRPRTCQPVDVLPDIVAFPTNPYIDGPRSIYRAGILEKSRVKYLYFNRTILTEDYVDR